MTAPTGEIRYAKSEGVHVAYQVVGGTGPDLVVVPGFVSHVECAFEHPDLARFVERLTTFARVTMFDKRGTGLSDRGGVSTLEERMDDIRAVMDDASIERASLFGISEGGPLTLLFAATYPQRVQSLALFGTYARICNSGDYAIGVEPGAMQAFTDAVEASWGTGRGLSAWAPDHADDARLREWWGRYQRLSASPADARVLLEAAAQIDVRDVLASVTAPVLVLHRRGDRMFPVAGARYLAERLPDARFVELDGSDHLFFSGGSLDVADQVEEFLTGSRATVQPDRVLATVLFTDIVRSTERLSEVGDAAWVRVLDQHDALVRRELERFRGREVKHTGDGFVASFDGPIRAIRCAEAIVAAAPGLGIEVRAGVHTGECELRGDDLGGLAVHLAARVAAEARPGEVLVSRTVTDLVAGSGLAFDPRGEHALKGLAGRWELFAVAQ